MRLKFKNQKFQADAADAAVDCFTGQPYGYSQFNIDKILYSNQLAFDIDTGFKNKKIELTPDEVFENIKNVQNRNGLKISPKLEGEYNLTIEMETGTGKTYTYIKTMYELYKKYGWSKYIIVVPSIAIREGVYKTFEITQEHFMEQYGKKIRYFIYNSKQLNKIEQFASDAGINVMIINSQAFNARGKDARRIYMELDEFQSRKPINVISQINPVLIIDEPQSVEGAKTKEALKLFNPLFTLRYSATHKEEYNKIYRLDALDAYNKKLVKKICVKGITVRGSTGTEGYLYLEGINLSDMHYPYARLEFEVKGKNGIRKELNMVCVGYDLYQHSNYMEQYKGYVVSEINGANNTLYFINGITIHAGEAIGDVNELTLRRIQIREAIESHFEKERDLFHKGIKTLTLFFIDEVAKYRKYDKDGNKANGEYADIFEEEYINVLNKSLTLMDKNDPYAEYLNRIDVKETHNGYFSIDKNGRMTNPKLSSRETESDDIDAYELIMKDKERLLSFKEPTRFIFSHSALREGWDNPNVFQICTLKHSASNIRKRQEVGRGLRLCVNQNGDRIDSSVPGIDVHAINELTIIASESYETFARDLQSEIAETLDRPHKADNEFFINKILTNEKGNKLEIDDKLARKIHNIFARKYYIDDEDNLTDEYYKAVENQHFEVAEEISDYKTSLIELVSNIYDEKHNKIFGNGRDKNIPKLEPNENFKKKQFQKLWDKINVKSTYTVNFNSDELIKKCIEILDKDLMVSDITYNIKHGQMKQNNSKEQLEQGEGFELIKSETNKVNAFASTGVKYDLIGKLVDGTNLTRKTITKILTGMHPRTFMLFKKNPEELKIKAARIINEQKATVIIECITYNRINEKYDNDIFTINNINGKLGENAISVKQVFIIML